MGEGADELFAGYEYLKTLGGDTRLKQELADMTVRLQDTNLQRADRMTMAHGIEGRVPFLDQDLVRYVSRVPASFLEPREDRIEKWLLREACRGLLPPAVLQRKKMKFSEGAGSAGVVAGHVRRFISPGEFERQRDVATGLTLRSPEELYYYRIWRDVMEDSVDPGIVGHTLDPRAAVES
jgi:asparagine synthase (glutamine-hydrolysing)